jgi:hypothetical protein
MEAQAKYRPFRHFFSIVYVFIYNISVISLLVSRNKIRTTALVNREIILMPVQFILRKLERGIVGR